MILPLFKPSCFLLIPRNIQRVRNKTKQNKTKKKKKKKNTQANKQNKQKTNKQGHI